MTSAMAPAEPADAELIKVMFADGENVWLVPEALHKFDAGQARDDRGRWTSGGSHDPGANPRAPYNRDYSVIKDGNGRTLGDLLKSGAPRDAMEAHPAMTQALKDAAAIRDTQTYPGYGTREFMDNRRFADGSRGYDQMSDKLVAKAESYAGEKGVLNGREAHIILGPPGAGKSSYAEPLARQIGAAIADADDAKAMFKEYGGGIGANAVHEESSILTGAVLKELVGRGANLVLPKVGASSGSIERLTAALKAQGYTVHLSVKDVDEATAYTRMIGRFLHNGRLISGKYLGEVDHNPQKVYRQLAATGNYASTKVV
jgi:shikimate kinase